MTELKDMCKHEWRYSLSILEDEKDIVGIERFCRECKIKEEPRFFDYTSIPRKYMELAWYSDYIEDLSEDKLPFHLSMGTNKEDKYYVELWFNDMFGWALSYVMTFSVESKNPDATIISFEQWLFENEDIIEEMRKVKYPDKDKDNNYVWPEVESYFENNSIIGNKIAKSINKFCGKDLNEPVMEENL